MIDKQPKPFFLRVWLKALAVASGDAIAFKPKQDYAAALTIQRAFAEREAELVGALKLARNRLQMCAVDAVASGNPRAYEWSEWADQTTAALKSREAGHG